MLYNISDLRYWLSNSSDDPGKCNKLFSLSEFKVWFDFSFLNTSNTLNVFWETLLQEVGSVFAALDDDSGHFLYNVFVIFFKGCVKTSSPYTLPQF